MVASDSACSSLNCGLLLHVSHTLRSSWFALSIFEVDLAVVTLLTVLSAIHFPVLTTWLIPIFPVFGWFQRYLPLSMCHCPQQSHHHLHWVLSHHSKALMANLTP